MNTLYITGTGRVQLDENNNPVNLKSYRSCIDDIYPISEDTKIIYKKGETDMTVDAKAGDLIIVFYENSYPNKVINVNSDAWKENIRSYDDAIQKAKEDWANKHCDDCENCKA